MFGTSEKALHQARGRVWVKTLARTLQQQLKDEDIRVFYRGNHENEAEFGVKKFLYDVHACRVVTSEATKTQPEFAYIQQSLWQIESTLSQELTRAVSDFNKLVAGSAENKLFVSTVQVNPQPFVDALLPLAKSCTGTVYLALIPHPKDWENPDYEIPIWQLDGEAWETVD